jgi:hypothetical protein
VGRRERPTVSRPDVETLHYPASEAAAKYGASAAKETGEGDEAYADWPGEYRPVRLPWQAADAGSIPAASMICRLPGIF